MAPSKGITIPRLCKLPQQHPHTRSCLHDVILEQEVNECRRQTANSATRGMILEHMQVMRQPTNTNLDFNSAIETTRATCKVRWACCAIKEQRSTEIAPLTRAHSNTATTTMEGVEKMARELSQQNKNGSECMAALRDEAPRCRIKTCSLNCQSTR